MWSKGTVRVPAEDGTYTVIKYEVKHYAEPSEWGYEGGRASKIWLQQDGREVYCFERGETRQLQTPEAAAALAAILKEYN
ncbi:MAG: hypothetical protein LUI10_07425 [Lachnospiraceae bacterium]|nr:hypothetical protein [Lachnospiraceae bacterium]MCD8382794.1 hypothetical protein [Clostridiales bacterium]